LNRRRVGFETPPARTPFPGGVSASLPTSAESRALSAALPGLGKTQMAWEMVTWLPGFQIYQVSGGKICDERKPCYDDGLNRSDELFK